MPDSTPKSTGVALPPWARRDHPILARELAVLPAFVSRGGSTRSKTGVMMLLGLAITPCMICGSCGYFPLELLFSLVGWLPLVWSVPVISREMERGTWEALRVTPYSTREIVLAKLSAVAYRLVPLLGFIITRQLVLIVSTGGLSLLLFLDIPAPSEAGQGLAIWLLALGLVAVVWTVASGLDFLANVTLGALAASLAPNRNLAYLLAFAARLGLSLLYAALTIGLAVTSVNLAAEQGGGPLRVIVYAAIAGALLLLAHGLVLAGMLHLTFWRAERL